MRLNVGCGLDVRDGWINTDLSTSEWAPWADVLCDARRLEAWHGKCEVVLLSHVLHLFDYPDADLVLDECVACLAPEGKFVIVEPDIIGMWDRVRAHDNEDLLRSLIADHVEPSTSGKLLRWTVWHGTRRSLWSREQLIDRLRRRGLETYSYWETLTREMDALLDGIIEPFGTDDKVGRRYDESFVVLGVKP